MASRIRPHGSIDQLFNKILIGSLLLHVGIFFFVMTVEPPPPPSQEEYASWLNKVTPPKVVEEVKPEPEPEPIKKDERKAEEPEEPTPTPQPTKAAPRAARARAAEAPPGEQSRRAAVRAQLSGAGLLASIGAAAEGGSLANVFESDAVVGKDLNEALSERGGVRVTGGTRIGKKGAVGSGVGADIGEIDAGAGGSAGAVGERKGVVPQAFVKSSEAVLQKGRIDEAGVNLALKRRERGIQQCYERALKSNAQLKGKVSLAWAIDVEGRVLNLRITADSLRDKNVTQCISEIISKIKFPKADKGIVPVQKTFVFEAG